MQFDQQDQIEVTNGGVYHKSAGGFVFFEEPKSHNLFVALIKPDGKDGFFIPKGHIKNNETPKEAAFREIKEELMLNKDPEFVSEIGVEKYSFTLDDSSVKHYKEVSLFLFRLATKDPLNAPKDENIEKSQWLEFYDALKQMPYDKDNLLKARQIYYFNKNKQINKLTPNKDQLSISVCMPTFNGAKTIKKTLESVLSSLKMLPSRTKKEICICLDHCTDNTEEIVNTYIKIRANNKIQIRVFTNTGDKGKPTAMNIMFKQTNSDLLYYVDDDVILDPNCIPKLIEALDTHNSKCVFSRWVRARKPERNPFKRLLQEILGIKFDVQPYKTPSDYLLGGSVLLLRNNYVHIPPHIANEDQFLQYIYWPNTMKVNESFIYFNSVNSLSDYYKRFIRITGSSLQMSEEFSKDRIQYCSKELKREIDIKKILNFPANQMILYILYQVIRSLTKIIVSVQLSANKNYVWCRIEQSA